MNQYLFIDQHGDALIVRQEPHETSLSCLQTLVGGLIQIVPTSKIAADVWVNEEGLFIRQFGINLVASYITGRQLVGPTVFASSTKDGDTIGLRDSVLNKLKREGLLIADEVRTSSQIAQEYLAFTVAQ
jgi:hypothetical protein